MGTRFVILAMARTGSGRLCDQLRAQPDIWCHNEVFHGNKVQLRTPFEDEKASRKERREFADLRERDRDAFLEEIFAMSFDRPHVGFKVIQNQGRGEAFRLLDDPSLAKVILVRANVLAMYSSLLAAKETGAWTSDKMLIRKREPVPFDEREFRDFHEKYTWFYGSLFEQVQREGPNVHVIRYDELNIPARMSMLLRFLGASPEVVPLEDDGSRGAPDIVSRFSNPDAVRAFLNGRGLMHWAYEGDMSFEPLAEHGSDGAEVISRPS